MSNLERRIIHRITFSFAAMEHHVHKFLNRFRPAFGLWRGGYRGTLSTKSQRDIERGLSGLIKPHTQDENALEPQSTESLGLDHEDLINPQTSTESLGLGHEDLINPQTVNSDPNDDTTNQEDLPQRQFTEGPSRFVLAKDGSRDCVALLVNEGFLAKLRDLFQEERDLSILDGPLGRAKIDLRNVERSVQEGQNALETAESEGEAENYHRIIEQHTSELRKVRRRKDELEEERDIVKGNLELSRNHTKWVLETAMREVDLLGPEKPLPAIISRDEGCQHIDEEVSVAEQSIPQQSPVASAISDHGEVELNQAESQRREAYNEFMERSGYLDTVQEKFDSQGFLYRENLAEYEEMAAAGDTDMARSEFDRRKVHYGQQLTRALIDAEEEFEEARDHALALNALTSSHGHDFPYGAHYEESWPENQIADYNASQDWTYVETWMDAIPDSNFHGQADGDDVAAVEEMEVDEWEAEEVEVNDSISMIDCEEYRRDIDRYGRMCARLGDPCPEARWLGQPDERVLERRGSWWM